MKLPMLLKNELKRLFGLKTYLIFILIMAAASVYGIYFDLDIISPQKDSITVSSILLGSAKAAAVIGSIAFAVFTILEMNRDAKTRTGLIVSSYTDYVRIIKDKFSIGHLSSLMVKKFTPIAAAKDIQMTSELDNADVVCADRLKIEQVFENLLSNAIKHTPQNGKILIWAEKNATELFIYVENSGAHIPDEELTNIWDMFYRVNGQKGKKTDSTGLGLAIVKRIFELHNSRYDVQNTENGVYFRFNLKIDDTIQLS